MLHKVTLITPSGTHLVECPEDQFILDVAARQGLHLPAVCRGGACSTCACTLVEGTPPDQSEQTYLSEEDIGAGYVLLCVAYAQGDCVLETHKAEQYLRTLQPGS
jgi:ferredoxin